MLENTANLEKQRGGEEKEADIYIGLDREKEDAVAVLEISIGQQYSQHHLKGKVFYWCWTRFVFICCISVWCCFQRGGRGCSDGTSARRVGQRRETRRLGNVQCREVTKQEEQIRQLLI